MSTSRKQVHAPVRGDGRRTGEKPAGPDVVAQVGEHVTRLWRLVRHYVDEARPYGDYTGVQAIGIDGTGRKGRNCITVVADQAERNMVRVVPGKDAHTVERFVQDFIDRNGDPNRVGLVTCDISLEFARGICEHLPNAAKVIDKFHTSSSTPTRPSTGVAGPRAGTTRNTCVCATKQTHPNPNWRSSAACGGVGPGPLGPAGCVSPAGHLRRQRRPDRDRNGGQSIALADDALPSGSHEGLGRHFGSHTQGNHSKLASLDSAGQYLPYVWQISLRVPMHLWQVL